MGWYPVYEEVEALHHPFYTIENNTRKRNEISKFGPTRIILMDILVDIMIPLYLVPIFCCVVLCIFLIVSNEMEWFSLVPGNSRLQDSL